MADPLTTLNAQSSLEAQFLNVLEAFSDLQAAYVSAFPNETPIQAVTDYSRDHLTGVITGSFTLKSTTTQAADGTVTVVPTPEDYIV